MLVFETRSEEDNRRFTHEYADIDEFISESSEMPTYTVDDEVLSASIDGEDINLEEEMIETVNDLKMYCESL